MLIRPSSVRFCVQFSLRKKFTSAADGIAEGEHVLLRMGDHGPEQFTKRLRRGRITRTRWGDISHDHIIGKQARDTVLSSKREEVRIDIPTLEEYVHMTPRLVTPIYSADANVIVSLLDLHPNLESHDVHGRDSHQPVQILEAGTGHGGLTLHLARALHAANPPVLPDLRAEVFRQELHSPQVKEDESEELNTPEPDGDSSSSSSSKHIEAPDIHPPKLLENYRLRRGAILHTLDRSQENSLHARKIVAAFRRGIYFPTVDFHVGDLESWLAARSSSPAFPTSSPTTDYTNVEPFLSHAILDLPNVHTHLEPTSRALLPNGNLLVFAPSISQIEACVARVRTGRLPLLLERVLELGPGLAGGRQWDVRCVRTRAWAKRQSERDKARNRLDSNSAEEGGAAMGSDLQTGPLPSTTAEVNNDEEFDHNSAETPTDTDVAPDSKVSSPLPPPSSQEDEEGEWQMVCRPATGVRTVGGGFVAVWRKMRFR